MSPPCRFGFQDTLDYPRREVVVNPKPQTGLFQLPAKKKKATPGIGMAFTCRRPNLS
jgi:hypothetical protein